MMKKEGAEREGKKAVREVKRAVSHNG